MLLFRTHESISIVIKLILMVDYYRDPLSFNLIVSKFTKLFSCFAYDCYLKYDLKMMRLD